MKKDLIIIGSGFAGLKAAQIASEAGQSFALVSKDFGATAHFSGAFDLIDPRLVDASVYGNAFDLQDSLERFVAANPSHLYAECAGQSDTWAGDLIANMTSFFDFYGLAVCGDGKTGVWCVSPMGYLKPAAFALKSQGFLADEIKPDSQVLVVGFPGLHDYPVELIARHLGEHFSNVQTKNYDALTCHKASPLVSLQRQMADESRFAAWCDFLKEQAKSYDWVLVPPVLGEKEPADYPQNVREMLSVLPSSSGSRVLAQVKKVLEQKGITLVQEEVTSVTTSAEQVQSLKLRSGEELSAEKFIWATGKFLGGGVSGGETFQETLLNLPLSVDGKPLAAQTHVTNLLQRSAFASQPFLTVGVARNDIPYENLAPCGHVLSDFDFTRERCGFGVSVASATFLTH